MNYVNDMECSHRGCTFVLVYLCVSVCLKVERSILSEQHVAINVEDDSETMTQIDGHHVTVEGSGLTTVILGEEDSEIETQIEGEYKAVHARCMGVFWCCIVAVIMSMAHNTLGMRTELASWKLVMFV
mmetsp:Transcript_26074/g.49528  ORF Transcript_26074/g.49528 Transcript_26074/m.49528 type:complete len:128 (+) Transcript_26074:159-542(+)